jgi:hypothetical protein
MSMAEWMALPPPGSSPNVRPYCTSAGSNEPGGGPVACGWASHYGKFSLPAALVLDKNLRVNSAHFLFRDDRLFQVDLRFPIDAYNALSAELETNYGAGGLLVRDRVKTELGGMARVQRRWTTTWGAIELVDPAAPYSELDLKLSSSGARSARAGTASVSKS